MSGRAATLGRDVLVVAALFILTVAFYYPLTVQGRVLASFDSLVYFYPNAVYLAQRLRLGQIPLWDPYLFAGVPFLANSQVGVLYPPNLLYLLGPVSQIYAVLVVLHVWWLAIGVYLLGRGSLGLSRPAALFAAVAVAFGGFVGGMDGHLNQLEALSWAPLAILAVERGAARASWRLQVAAAFPFALAALAGHSQELYMTGVVAGLAGASRVAQRRPVGWALVGEVGRLAIGPVLAILMAAAQLLPTLELTRLSIRSTGLDFANAAAFSLPPPLALTTLLPTVNQPPPSTEWLGYVGLTTIVLGLSGLRRRPAREAWWLAGLALVGLALAVGKYAPFYPLAFDVVPGVRLFRVPARWLTLWTLGTALLAGWGIDSLAIAGTAVQKAHPGRRPRRIPRLLSVSLPGVALIPVAALIIRYHQIVSWPTTATLTLWCTTLVGTLAAVLLARRQRRSASFLCLALLVGELAVASLGLPVQQAVFPDAVETPRLSVDHLLARQSTDRILALGDNSFDPGDLPELRQMLDGALPPDAVASYITAVKHVEVLTPNLPLRFGLRTIDGYDGGVLPLDRFDDFKRLFPVQGTVVSDGRLRLQLKAAPDPRLLGWLNVRYLLMNRLADRWIGGVYYDLAVAQTVEPNAPLGLAASSPFPATSIGIAFRQADGSAPSGTLAITAGGETRRLAVGPGQPPGQHIPTDVDPNGVWLWTLDLARPELIRSVRLTWQGNQPITLRSLSLIDRRSGASQPVVVSPAYRLDFLGDVKVYENQDVLPRAFLTTGLAVVPTVDQVVARLSSGGWQPQRTAVASAEDVAPALAFQSGGVPGDAHVVSDQPERIVVDTEASGRRLLVLTDSFYPGWHASVDGSRVPILPVNTLFRGVILTPGAHTVVFSYEPWTWRAGVVLSGVGLVAALLGLASGLGIAARSGGPAGRRGSSHRT